jgi:glutathione S-transferase
MPWVQLVALLAVCEFFGFALAVAGARRRYGVPAPATSGNADFERYFRVQQNTLEQLIMFLPSLFIAAAYWNPQLVAAVGAFFLVGRLVYFRGYVREARQRHTGFLLGIAPTVALALAALIGVVRALLGT